MKQFSFPLHITSEQYLDYYRGTVKSVLVRAADGKTVQFPAKLLQRHVTTEGIHGNFVLICDDHYHCIELQKDTSPN